MSRISGHDMIQILLVDDNPGDIELTREALHELELAHSLHVAQDGVEALEWLRRGTADPMVCRADLILMDLNLPKKDGWELLTEIKADAALRRIPVMILSTSAAETDILNAYDLHANSYITKPVDLDTFINVMRSIEMFWLTVAKLPPR